MEFSPAEKLRENTHTHTHTHTHTYMFIGEEDFLKDRKAACLKADSLSSENRERLKKWGWG